MMNVTILNNCAYFKAGQKVSVTDVLGTSLIADGNAVLTAKKAKPVLADDPPVNKRVKRRRVSRK